MQAADFRLGLGRGHRLLSRATPSAQPVLNLYLHIQGLCAPNNERLGRRGWLQRGSGGAQTRAMLRRTLFILLVAFLVCLPAQSALSKGWAGADPGTNFAVGQLPESCDGAGGTPPCIGVAVSYLDRARA